MYINAIVQTFFSHACGTASFRDRGDVYNPNNRADHRIHRFILACTPKPSHYKSSVPQFYLVFSHLVANSSLRSTRGGQEQLHFSLPTRQHATQAQCNKPIACNLCIVQIWSMDYIQSITESPFTPCSPYIFSLVPSQYHYLEGELTLPISENTSLS